jgi:transcriptional regulator with XRE-family HTH domain
MPSDPLARVKRASEAKRRAEHEYRSALEAGREAGLSFADMAKAAGVSRQAARQMLAKRPVTDEAAMTERLTELDARWDALVAAIAETFMPADPRAEQAIRNGTNAKAKRTLAGVNRNGKASGSIGRHRVILPTVRQEARNLAEAKILRMLEHRGDEPLVQRIVGELDEAYALRQKLTALRDTRVFGSPV